MSTAVKLRTKIQAQTSKQAKSGVFGKEPYMIEVDWLVLARGAEPGINQTAAILGAGAHTFFSQPMTYERPAGAPAELRMPIGTPISLFVVIRLLASRSELHKTHNVSIRVSDVDGRQIIPELGVAVVTQDDPHVAAGGQIPSIVIAQLPAFGPTYFGIYSVEVIVDSSAKKHTTFQVLQLPPNQERK